jgi:hypothetical protein
MSSNGSFNVSNESPNKAPLQLLPQDNPITLSPHTIQTTLQTQPDIDTTLLRGIANGLLQTIANWETDTTVAAKRYEDCIHMLES